MDIRTYSGQEMEERFGTLMEAHEDVHQLLLGDIIYIRKLKAKGMEIPEHTFGAVMEEERPLWFFCAMLPYATVVTPALSAEWSAPAPAAGLAAAGSASDLPAVDEAFRPKECAAALAAFLKEHAVRIAGVQSTPAFAEAFRISYGGEYRLELAMDIMTAQAIVPQPRRGQLVHGTIGDLDEVTALSLAFVRECLHEEHDPEEMRKSTEIRLTVPDSIFWLYKRNGETIGCAASTRKLGHGRGVSYVYIKPEYRRQGLCKEMMAALGEECFEEGCRYLTLYVDQANPFSNAAYTAVGYRYVVAMESWMLKDESITT